MKIISRIIYLILMSFTPSKKKYLICQRFHKVKFGKNVSIIGSPRWASESYLISIGDDVTIGQNSVFHTHDGGVRVFRKDVPGINVFGKITVGNNVFIGSDTIILPNVSIGNNVVIGSGSVVSKSIPDNVVAAGVPAKPIKSIEDYQANCILKGIVVPANLSKEARKAFIIQNLS